MKTDEEYRQQAIKEIRENLKTAAEETFYGLAKTKNGLKIAGMKMTDKGPFVKSISEDTDIEKMIPIVVEQLKELDRQGKL